MSRDPNVDLFESRFQSFFQLSHAIPFFGTIFDINANAQQLIGIYGGLILPCPRTVT